MHRAVAAKDHGHVGQIVGLQGVAAEHVDPRVAEGLHNVGFYIRVRYGCGSHGEIVQRRALWREKLRAACAGGIGSLPPARQPSILLAVLCARRSCRGCRLSSRPASHSLPSESSHASSRRISGDSALRFVLTYSLVYAHCDRPKHPAVPQAKRLEAEQPNRVPHPSPPLAWVGLLTLPCCLTLPCFSLQERTE